MATTVVITCVIAVIITLSIMCLWLKNKLSRKPLQARCLPLSSPIEIDSNKGYDLQPSIIEIIENEAYGTNVAHRNKDN